MPHVDIDLLRRECRPQSASLAGLQASTCEGQSRPRPIDRGEVLLTGAVWEYGILRQEQAGHGAMPRHVAESR